MVFASSMVALWHILNIKVKPRQIHAYFLITFGISNVITQIVIMVMNLKLLRYLKDLRNKNSAAKQRGVKNCKKYVTVTILLISITIIVCALPGVVIYFIYAVLMLSKNYTLLENLKVINPWLHLPVLINSGLNSLIYTTRTKSIRRYYRIKFEYYKNLKQIIFRRNIVLQDIQSV